MKKQMLWMGGLALLAAGTAWAEPVIARYNLQANFETNMVGARPGGWTITDVGANCDFLVSSTANPPGSTKSLHYLDNSSTLRGKAERNFTTDAPGDSDIYFSFDWMVPTGANSIMTVSIYGANQYARVEVQQDRIRNWPMGWDGAQENILTGLSRDIWYRAELILHPNWDGLTNARYDIKITRLSDNVVLNSTTNWRYRRTSNTATFTKFTLGPNRAGSTTGDALFVDNVVVGTIAKGTVLSIR